MKNTFLILCLTLLSTGFLKAQIVNIPDANFKAYLVNNPEINTNGDNEIHRYEAEAFTGGIWCGSLEIVDLTGIEAFVNITSLSCDWNSLTALDVRQNVALRNLTCRMNRLTELDVSQNVALEALDCSWNKLRSLNMKNGNNINMIVVLVDNNPDLSCIEVDDIDIDRTNWSKDKTAELSTDCQYLSKSELSLTETLFYPNPIEDMLYFEEPMSAIRLVDYSGRVIQEYKYTTDRINLASLTDGVYFIVGRTAGGEYVGGKVVKTDR